jgi:hypothetical protein
MHEPDTSRLLSQRYSLIALQRAPFRLFSGVSAWHPDMVQMNFETFSQAKPSFVLNNIPQYVPDRISIKLVPASQTNLHHFILYIFSVADSHSQQISTRYFIN